MPNLYENGFQCKENLLCVCIDFKFSLNTTPRLIDKNALHAIAINNYESFNYSKKREMK